MSLWLLITLALTVQEGLSVLAVLLRAYQLHYSIWIISLIWLVATTVQITIGYYVGKWIRKNFVHSKFEKWVEKYADKIQKSIDKNGEKIGIVLLSSIISPAIAGFVAPWLDISFGTVFLYALLGDLFWYVSTWATVLGAEQILSGVKEGFVVIIIIAIIWVVFSHFRKNKTP